MGLARRGGQIVKLRMARSRRLELADEATGTLDIAIRRWRGHYDPVPGDSLALVNAVTVQNALSWGIVPFLQSLVCSPSAFGRCRMVTLKDLAEDWITARAALKQQLKVLESNPISPQAGLSEDARMAIAARINKAISELNALLKEFPNA
jgi:hypothetical protein